MPPLNAAAHYHILEFPEGHSPSSGRLDALRLNENHRRIDLVMDYQELNLAAPPVLFERDGKIWERVKGDYQPRRLIFQGVKIFEGEGLCAHLGTLPPDHPSRAISGALAWRSTERKNRYMFSTRTEEHPFLRLEAK